MTPAQMVDHWSELWRQGKLDQRCRSCGEGSAASSRCFRCGSTDLDYIPHGSEGWTACLAGHGAPAERVSRDTSAATAARRGLPGSQRAVARETQGSLGLE